MKSAPNTPAPKQLLACVILIFIPEISVGLRSYIVQIIPTYIPWIL
jgi:hypothetical protein